MLAVPVSQLNPEITTPISWLSFDRIRWVCPAGTGPEPVCSHRLHGERSYGAEAYAAVGKERILLGFVFAGGKREGVWYMR